MKRFFLFLISILIGFFIKNTPINASEKLYTFLICESNYDVDLNDEFNIEPSSSTNDENNRLDLDKDKNKEEKYWAQKIKDDFGKKFDYIEYSASQLMNIHSRIQWSMWIKQDFDKDYEYTKYSLKQLIDIYNRLQWLEWIKRDFGFDYSESKYSAYELRMLYNSFKKINHTK